MIYINSTKLTNFRNFKSLDLELGRKATIFIGRNGMGKTNLLTAVKQSLSFIFSKKSDTVQYNFIASSDQKVKSFLPTDPLYVKDIENRGVYTYPIAVESSLTMENGDLLNWELRRLTSDKGINESYATKSVAFWKHYPDFKGLPVIAFFSDSYPHISTSIGSKMQRLLSSGNDLPKNVAYYKWDDERNCTEIWKQYFVMNYKNNMYREDIEKTAYINAVTSCLKSFTEPVSLNHNNADFVVESVEIEARGKEDVIIVVFVDGRRIPFDLLPQGYKRILSIVFDIAHRSYLLNKDCNPHGVIFIDEVELHLHPSLAQEVVSRLTTAFPDVQFILSTHSPLVIADYKQDGDHLLYKLDRVDGNSGFTRLKNLYGMDFISVLRSIMDTPERDSYLTNLIGAYQYWKSIGDTKRMKQVFDVIRSKVGDNSAVILQNNM